MGTLYVAVDLFYPGVYRPDISLPGAESYAHEDGYVYVVLQPVVTTATNTDPILPPAYFSLTGPDLGATHTVKFLDENASQDISKSAVPVLFPPLSRLGLALEWNDATAPVNIDRVIPTQRVAGEPVDSPLLLEVGRWAEFAVSNFAVPAVTEWGHLKPAAQAAILSWGVSLVPRIIRRVHANDATDPLTAPERDAYELLRQLEQQMTDPDAPVPEAQVRAYLQAVQDGAPRIAKLWVRMSASDASTGKHAMQAPRFLHDQASLSTDPVRLLGLSNGTTPIAVSYHQKLWRDIGRSVSSSDQKTSAEGINALGRLFGFGERLRWPRPPQNQDAFMVASPTAKRVQGFDAIGTNVHSLLGQVFRLQIKVGSGTRPKSMRVSVQGVRSLDLTAPLSMLLDRIDAAPHGPFNVSLARDADRPSGFFLYMPKMAEAGAVDGADPAKAYHTVPQSLLDAVDRRPRWSTLTAADRLIMRLAPRSALRASELYKLETLGTAVLRLRHKVHVQDASATGAALAIYKVSLGADLHPDEAVEFSQRLATLDAAGAELWVTLSSEAGGGVSRWSVQGRVIDTGRDENGAFAVIADIADAANSLRALLSKAAHPAGNDASPDAETGHFVDLVFGETTIADPLFNLLVRDAGAQAVAPLCILNSSFTSRISASTDRVMDRLELALSPSPFPHVGNEPLLDHLANFNKLRVALSGNDPQIVNRTERPPGTDVTMADGRVVTFLTYPDAAAPMSFANYSQAAPPWLMAAPPVAGRHYGYFLSHVFTQDSRADGGASQVEQNAAEALRYINYLTPQIPWALEGYAEHQYTYRIPFSTAGFRLPLTTDIHHAATAAKREGSETSALLRWDFVEAGPKIRLAFSRKYIKLALGEGDAGSRPARLRAIYEPLADLVAAVDRGTAVLELERWVFDSDLPDRSLDPDPSSAIASNFRRAGKHTHALRSNASVLRDLQTIRQLLDKPLTAFEQALAALGSGSGADWLVIDIPFDGQWTASGEPFSGTITQASDALRLGLRLTRAGDSVADPALVPADRSRAPGFGVPADKDRLASYPALHGENFETLKVKAAEELATYLSDTQPSPLRESFGWLRATPQPMPARAGNPTNPEDVFDPNRLRRIFGELTPYLLIPMGQRPRLQRVVDVFYAPLAFRPLKEHPQFGDPATTLEFAEFLLQILDDVCNGRPTASVQNGDSTQRDAHAVAKRLTAELLPVVARQLVALIAHVHNDEDLGSMANPLCAYVDKMVKRVMAGSFGALERCKDLLTDAPGLYATSKGFGLAMIEPDAWTDRIHAIQITKKIHAAGDPLNVTADDPNYDRDRFLFDRIAIQDRDRFIIDVLDDARYDNEFEIAQRTFRPPRIEFDSGKPVPVNRDRQTLVTRGAAQARSGEDSIEQRNPFIDTLGTDRQIEIDVVHWNPSWITKSPSGDARRFYLLPSRRYPATPTVLKPKYGGDDTPPWRCPLDLTFTTAGEKPNLATKISDRLGQILAEQSRITFSGGRDDDLVASRITTGGARFALAAPANTQGWWHVESYGTAHYFLIEPDEEADQNDDILANDRFAIDVELNDAPPGEETIPTPALPAPCDGVTAWFQYRRKLQTDSTATAPASIPIARLGDELRSWLSPPQGQDTSELLQPYQATTSAVPVGATRTLTRFDHTQKQLVQLEGTGHTNSIGSVLAAEILQLRKSTGEKLPRYVLRVVVLDEPWHYTRVRVRIERNFRNMNGDALPDINKAFQMLGKFSGWSTHGREPIVVDFGALAKRNLPANLSRMRVALTAAQYLALQPDADPHYGDLLGTVLRASFLDSNNKPQSFWNLDRATNAKLRIGGLIMQERSDLHPRYGRTDVSTQEPARTEHIARQHLASVSAGQTLGLFAPVVRGQSPNLHQLARLAWSNDKNEPLLVCVWPLLFG